MIALLPDNSTSSIKLTVCLLALLSAAIAPRAAAQTATVTVNSTVPQVLSLTIDTVTVLIPFLTTDYNASTGAATKTVTGANTLSVTSNKSWTVTLKANAAAFTFAGSDPDPSKPCGNLSYKVSTSGTYTAITTSNVTVKTGNKGGTATAGNTFVMDYQLTSNLSQDPPGTYTLAILYTLTAP